MKWFFKLLRRYLRRFTIARFLFNAFLTLTFKIERHLLNTFLPSISWFSKKAGLPWARVFELRSNMYMRQIKWMSNSGSHTFSEISEMSDKAIQCIEHAIFVNPCFVRGGRLATNISIENGRVKDTGEWVQKWHALKETAKQKNQICNLGVSFINSTPIQKTIGATAVYNAYIKCEKLGISPPNKLVMLVRGGKSAKFVNPHLLNYWRQYIDIIDEQETIRVLEPLENILTANDFDTIKVKDKVLLPHVALTWAEHFWQEEHRPPLFVLTKEDKIRGEAELVKLGIPGGARFVCLHVREGGARFDEPFRQSNILNYTKAIKAITDRGFWVIRMGDNSMTHMADMENIIDYVHTPQKSDFMDVYLCGACEFFVGTSSGLYTVAQMFGRPIVQTNYLPTGAICLTRDDLFLPKLLLDNKTGNLISFETLFSPPFTFGASDFFFKEVADVTPVDNTSEELEALIVEMVQKIDGTQKYTSEESELQNRFLNMTADVETLFGLPGVPINARMGQHFLNTYQHLMTGDQISETAGAN